MLCITFWGGEVWGVGDGFVINAVVDMCLISLGMG